MNLHPFPGDRWTREGHEDLEVLEVGPTKAKMRQGKNLFDITIYEYAVHAAASVRNGATLHRKEIEECLFE